MTSMRRLQPLLSWAACRAPYFVSLVTVQKSSNQRIGGRPHRLLPSTLTVRTSLLEMASASQQGGLRRRAAYDAFSEVGFFCAFWCDRSPQERWNRCDEPTKECWVAFVMTASRMPLFDDLSQLSVSMIRHRRTRSKRWRRFILVLLLLLLVCLLLTPKRDHGDEIEVGEAKPQRLG